MFFLSGLHYLEAGNGLPTRSVSVCFCAGLHHLEAGVDFEEVELGCVILSCHNRNVYLLQLDSRITTWPTVKTKGKAKIAQAEDFFAKNKSVGLGGNPAELFVFQCGRLGRR